MGQRVSAGVKQITDGGVRYVHTHTHTHTQLGNWQQFNNTMLR